MKLITPLIKRAIFLSIFSLLLAINLIAQSVLPQQEHLVLGERSVLIIRGTDPDVYGVWNDTDEDLLNVQIELEKHLPIWSFNRASLGTFDITPAYTYSGNPADDPQSIDDQVEIFDSLAIADGYDPNAYNTVIYLSQGGFEFNGAGALGTGDGNHGHVWFVNAGGFDFMVQGMIHETLHTYGLGHANILEGGDVMFPGINAEGLDPYHNLGSAIGFDLPNISGLEIGVDLPIYMQYRIGWVNNDQIYPSPPELSTCDTLRIYNSALSTEYVPERKYGIEIEAPNDPNNGHIWINFEPENLHNQQIQTHGLLYNYIPFEGANFSRLIDIHPNTLEDLTLIGEYAQPMIDCWDAAAELNETVYWGQNAYTLIQTGGVGKEQWADVSICPCSLIGEDSDNDGVCDANDNCPGGDDNIDTDGDGLPDDCDCQAWGQLTMEKWNDIQGDNVDAIPLNSSPDSSSELGLFEIPQNVGENYGIRVSGSICAPQTGNYVFWIASDNSGELWLSTDETPENKELIASVATYTGPREWDLYPEQQSIEIYLEETETYYIEGLMKEGLGGDHLAVGWRLPDQTLIRPMTLPTCFLDINDCPTSQSEGINLNITAALQGALLNTTGTIMRDDLRANNIIPLYEPYAELGYTHAGSGGGEGISADLLLTTGINAVVDWVLIEVYGTNQNLLSTQCALITRNGQIINTLGNNTINFSSLSFGDYYIAIKHRNHLGVMTKDPISFNNDIVQLNFADVNFQSWGTNAQVIQNSINALRVGNVSSNNTIIFQGPNNDNSYLFFDVLTTPNNTSNIASYIATDYLSGDLDMNGQTIFQGPNNDVNHLFFNVLGHPENSSNISNFIISEQIP